MFRNGDSLSHAGHRLRALVTLTAIVVILAAPLAALAISSNATPPGRTVPASGTSPTVNEPGASELAAAASRKKGKKQKGKGDREGKRKKKPAANRQKGKHQGTKKKGQGNAKNKDKGKTKGKQHGKKDNRDKARQKRANDTVTAAAADLTFSPAADAQVSEGNPNYAYGTRSRMLIDGGSDLDSAAYLRFDVSGVSGSVQQATLRVWVGGSGGGSSNGPEARATGTNWTETTITWNNRPAPSGGVLDDKGNIPADSWAEYNVTAAVTGNGAVGFVLLPQGNDGLYIDAREGTNRPQLLISLGGGGTNPTPTPGPNPTPTPGPNPTPTPPPGGSATLLAAGDIASCSSSGDEATAALLDSRSGTIAALGDLAYESGSASEFTNCYGPSWGRHKSRTRPAPGNHEYQTSGAAGYYGYFGAAAGDPQKGYYSYNLGAWHVVVLNSNCSEVGGCGAGSAQEQWLRQDLAASTAACTLAYWHHPRFSFGNYGNDTRTQALWRALYDDNAEIVLSGHDHNYQRYAPLDANGNRDATRGIRAFVVGTGGRGLYDLGSPPSTVEASNDSSRGVLQLTLRANGYDWQFIPVAGQSYSDTGSTQCH